jgi:hypothetical protein
MEKKEDMKKRGFRSPDMADALGLTFARPINKRKKQWNKPLKPAIKYVV